MEKFKKVVEWALLILKFIFIIAAIIIGIKLICFLLIPFLPFTIFSFSPFETFDWGPISTIIGAIITGLIAYYAIFKTSELDRKARIFEANYKFIQNKYIELYNMISDLISFDFVFLTDSYGTISRKPESIENRLQDFYKIKNAIRELKVVKPDFDFLVELDNNVDLYVDILQRYYQCIWGYENRIDKNYNPFEFLNKVNDSYIIDIQKFLQDVKKHYFENKKIDYDMNSKVEFLKEVQNKLLEQFKMED